MKVALNEKRKKLCGFSFSINIANFEAFLSVFTLTKNLFFSEECQCKLRLSFWQNILRTTFFKKKFILFQPLDINFRSLKLGKFDLFDRGWQIFRTFFLKKSFLFSK